MGRWWCMHLTSCIRSLWVLILHSACVCVLWGVAEVMINGGMRFWRIAKPLRASEPITKRGWR